MATQPDKVFVQSYEWFREAVDHVLAGAPWPAADKARVEKLVWKLIGRINVDWGAAVQAQGYMELTGYAGALVGLSE